ncbi:MAG: fused MFS/spermidine synthase [Nitrospinae bacterium]|nr:fused MFS/spermidine synthase [Nitrospinota bacterium]
MKPSPRYSKSALLAAFCMFLSGAASLVYELVWIKRFTLLFGGTLYAISAVLCAFMGGLALGGWAIAKYLEGTKGRNPDLIRMYGTVEGLIGIYALLFPLGLQALESVYGFAVGRFGGSSGGALHFAEFVLSALLMLPATFLMGTTLPLVGSWSVGGRVSRMFPDISFFYGINTSGAVFGCLFAQFFAIERLGLQGVSWLSAGTNAAVFLVCRFLPNAPLDPTPPRADAEAAGVTPDSLSSRRSRSVIAAPPPGDCPAPSRPLGILLLTIFALSGFASLASEILWTRVLVFPLGSALYSFALILATFLAGIALGSLAAEKLLGNSRWVLKFLLVELAVAAFCIGVIPVFDLLPELTARADRLFYDEANTFPRTLSVRSLFAVALMFPPTAGFGILFPLANRINISLFGGVGGTLGASYAINTLGAVLGTVAAPFVLIPALGIRGSLFAIYSVLAVLSCAGLCWHVGWKPARSAAALVLGGVAVFGGYAWSHPGIAADRMGKGNFARLEIDVPADRSRLLDYKEGDFATLGVVEDKESGARTLYVNGFSTATVSPAFGASSYMEAMGFVPMALHPNPKRALVICFGTGNTMGTASLFPGVLVDGVEIDRNVLSLAHWFSQWNHGVLQRPNARMTVQDGRSFLRWTGETYDVITLEPMSPVQAGVAHLYSEEFYRLADRALNPGGSMMQWLPLHLVGPADARAIVKTFRKVFPRVAVWNSFLTRITLLVGSREPIVLDKNRFDALMGHGDLRRSAEKMGVRSFADFADFHLADADRLQEFLKDADVVTDDRPILEYSPVSWLPPLQWETDETFLNILRFRADSPPPVKDLSPEEKAGFDRELRLRSAQRFSVFSQRYHGPGEGAFAARDYLAGLEEVKAYLDANKGSLISLEGGRWGTK